MRSPYQGLVEAVSSPHRPSAVLFACNENAVRSPIAEALLRHLSRNSIYVESCGVRAGTPNPFAETVMDEIGVSLHGHVPKTFAEIADTSFDQIISLTPEAHHHALELSETMALDAIYWPTADPTAVWGSREQVLSAFRAIRDQLMRRIEDYFDFRPPTNA